MTCKLCGMTRFSVSYHARFADYCDDCGEVIEKLAKLIALGSHYTVQQALDSVLAMLHNIREESE